MGWGGLNNCTLSIKVLRVRRSIGASGWMDGGGELRKYTQMASWVILDPDRGAVIAGLLNMNSRVSIL